MFDVGWSELLLIGVVALIVVGPKDLPVMFHTLGRFTSKARTMARDFQRAMDEAAKQSGVADVAKDLNKMASPKSLGIDKMQAAASKFEAWDPLKKAPTPTTPKGPATQALSEEREALRIKVEENATRMAIERREKEAAAAAAAAADTAGTAKEAKAAAKPRAPRAKAAADKAAPAKAAAPKAVKAAGTAAPKPAAPKPARAAAAKAGPKSETKA